METRSLDPPREYDLRTQRVVGQYVAALEDQHALLSREVGQAGLRELEWQPRRGVNTVGMLLAHLAVAECWWLNVVATDQACQPDADERIFGILGLRPDDDGLPLTSDGTHPSTLSGREWRDYDVLLKKAHEAGQRVVVAWTDADLDHVHRTAKRGVTRAWILYHVLEHFSAHFGQILLLRHLMRAEGLWQTA